MSYDAFIKKWTHPSYPPTPVDVRELATLEAKLGVPLPAAYKGAIGAFGAASAHIGLLNAIVDSDLDLADVQEFKVPRSIIETTQAWREMGLPLNCVAFANDCAGNLFCFRKGSDSVWFWDHDFAEIEQVASDFDTWIEAYLEVEPVPEDD